MRPGSFLFLSAFLAGSLAGAQGVPTTSPQKPAAAKSAAAKPSAATPAPGANRAAGSMLIRPKGSVAPSATAKTQAVTPAKPEASPVAGPAAPASAPAAPTGSGEDGEPGVNAPSAADFIKANTVSAEDIDYAAPLKDALKIPLKEGAEVDVEDQTEPEKIPRLEIIVDSSGSMGQFFVKNKTRMYYLKKMITRYFKDQWKERAETTLRVYGSRRKGDCEDNLKLFDFSEQNLSRAYTTIAGLFPVGRTPLMKSVSLAIKDLETYDGPKRIIIFTDGEDTCGGDPCKMGKELAAKKDLDLKIYVVAIAFDPDANGVRKVSCLGESSQSDNEEDMYQDFSNFLNQIHKDRHNLVVVSPDPRAPVDLYTYDGKEWKFLKTFTASFGTSVPPGEYQAVVRLEKPFRFDRFLIPPKKKVTLTVSGYGKVLVKFRDSLLKVEVLDRNMRIIDKFRSDNPKRVREGKWKLKIYREPFYEIFVDSFLVIPQGDHLYDVVDAGAVRIKHRETRGLYVYGEQNALLGNHLTNTVFVVPPGAYRFYVGPDCDMPELAVVPGKDIQEFDCANPKLQSKKQLPIPAGVVK